jgi:dynein heavy chain
MLHYYCIDYYIAIVFVQTMVEELKRLFEKFVLKIQAFKKMAQCKELVAIPELNGIISLCKLFDVLAVPENGVRE